MRKKDLKALDATGAYIYEIPQNLSMVAEARTQYEEGNSGTSESCLLK